MWLCGIPHLILSNSCFSELQSCWAPKRSWDVPPEPGSRAQLRVLTSQPLALPPPRKISDVRPFALVSSSTERGKYFLFPREIAVTDAYSVSRAGHQGLCPLLGLVLTPDPKENKDHCGGPKCPRVCGASGCTVSPQMDTRTEARIWKSRLSVGGGC